MNVAARIESLHDATLAQLLSPILGVLLLVRTLFSIEFSPNFKF